VALSIDEPVLSRALADELGLAFPLLCDPTSAVVDLYGVRNRLLGVKSGIPHPAVFLIDAGGIIRHGEVRHNYRRRVSPSRIFRWLDELPEAGQAE
jgi:peroxiredoxin